MLADAIATGCGDLVDNLRRSEPVRVASEGLYLHTNKSRGYRIARVRILFPSADEIAQESTATFVIAASTVDRGFRVVMVDEAHQWTVDVRFQPFDQIVPVGGKEMGHAERVSCVVLVDEDRSIVRVRRGEIQDDRAMIEHPIGTRGILTVDLVDAVAGIEIRKRGDGRRDVTLEENNGVRRDRHTRLVDEP